VATGTGGRDRIAVARVGPTTPTRAGRLADASVDPTDARNAQYTLEQTVYELAAQIRAHMRTLVRRHKLIVLRSKDVSRQVGARERELRLPQGRLARLPPHLVERTICSAASVRRPLRSAGILASRSFIPV
jgi:hypothetical protein